MYLQNPLNCVLLPALIILPLQYKCCGIDNSSDWVTLNPDAVVANGGVPPANCECNSNKTDDCVQFLYSGQTEDKFVRKDVS